MLTAGGLRLLVAAFLLAVTVVGSVAVAASYTVGVVPQFSARKVQSIWIPLLEELERRTGHTFVLRGSQNIPMFAQQLMDGEFDFAYMNPYQFVRASDVHGFVPLVRDIEKNLRGILVVREDSAIDDVAGLQGGKVAFPSPNALGASLMMRALLAREIGIDVDPVYVESHDSVYLNVVLGRVLAGGGVGRTLAKQPPQIREQLRVLYTTPAVASHPFAAHRRIPEDVRQQVQTALIEMGSAELESRLLKKVPIAVVGPASSEDYDQLRAMGLEPFYVNQ